MQEISISEFKAKCLALLDEVNKTRKPIRITRRGKPIAEVVPSAPAKRNVDWIGSMKGRMEILGDIVSPVINLDEIEALKE
ncbi:MAG TPA: type II toxin-antitoxin system Phd/YefM family antitoxin [Terriglobales bacterium]|nr:type II toxin-antitoxin system Phd/YefM family antitoxin [Terriglobales bacterium]